jgi:hypothetical protein
MEKEGNWNWNWNVEVVLTVEKKAKVDTDFRIAGRDILFLVPVAELLVRYLSRPSIL